MEYQKYAVIDIGSNSLRLMTGWQEVPARGSFRRKNWRRRGWGKISMKHTICHRQGWKRPLRLWKAGKNS